MAPNLNYQNLSENGKQLAKKLADYLQQPQSQWSIIFTLLLGDDEVLEVMPSTRANIEITPEEFNYFKELESVGLLSMFPMAQDQIKVTWSRNLLSIPLFPISPTIFISYSNKHSSSFALLLESRLKASGFNSFLDAESLRGGDDWWQRIQDTIQDVTHFICLVREGTLDSEYVCKEIIAAKTSNPHVRITWIYHHLDQLNFENLLRPEQVEASAILKAMQGYEIMVENTREYNRIVQKFIEDIQAG